MALAGWKRQRRETIPWLASFLVTAKWPYNQQAQNGPRQTSVNLQSACPRLWILAVFEMREQEPKAQYINSISQWYVLYQVIGTETPVRGFEAKPRFLGGCQPVASDPGAFLSFLWCLFRVFGFGVLHGILSVCHCWQQEWIRIPAWCRCGMIVAFSGNILWPYRVPMLQK